MKITNAEKFLLALMLCGCLTVTARATDRIENPTGTTIEITGGTFSGLSDVAEEEAYGGAVYNAGTITEISNSTFTGNSAVAEDEAYGGAIYNAGTIGGITGDFAGNYGSAEEEAHGGAIYNEDGTITSITGSFTGNYTQGEGESLGGAIYSEDGETISSIVADFTGNFAGGYDSYGDAVSGSAAGGAIYLDYTEVESVTGNFTGNYAVATVSANGGAIYLSDGGKIATITGNFKDNYVEAGMIAHGGAIYITDETFSLEIVGNFENNHAVSGYTATGGAITDGGAGLTITGDLKNNYAEAGSGDAYGGAIYYADGINEGIAITGDVTGNHATSSGGSAYGGALVFGGDTEILDEVNGDITGNWAKAENGYAIGGALYNASTTTVVGALRENYAVGGELALGGAIYTKGELTVTGDFTGNYATADGNVYGGAVAALSGELGDMQTTITGNFENNYALSKSGDAYGGAVLTYHDADNRGTMTTTVTGNFTGNYAQAENGSAMGGAVYNSDTTTLVGDFTGNYAQGEEAYGGAIYNAGTIGDITGDFAGNYVSAEEEAYGGAIYNEDGTISSITGSFTGNYAQGEEESYGGAIYSEDGEETIISIAANFTGNYAGGYDSNGDAVSGSAAGGAIYLDYTEVESITGDFTGNYAVGTGSATGGAIHLSDGGKIATITGNFTDNYVEAGLIANGGAIYITDGITIEIVGNFENNHATSGYNATGGAITASESVLTITGDLKNNYIEAGLGEARGGAIYVTSSDRTYFVLNGNVTGNHASSSGGDARGGALVLATDRNVVTGDIIGNWVEAKNGKALGGAIFGSVVIVIEGSDEGTATIQGNYAVGGELAMGGAVYSRATMEIRANFIDNYVMAVGEDGDAYGGAIAGISAAYEEQDDEQVVVEGNFENNRAISNSGDAYGGAVVVYHFAGEAGALSADLEGDFIGNYAVAENGKAMGGGVYNSDVTEITGDFTGNYVQGEEAYGGAIYNGLPGDDDYDAVFSLNGNLSGNFAQGENKAYGGGVYNESNMAVYAGMELTDNHAASEAGEAKGGAFYNSGLTLTRISDNDEDYEGYLVFGDVSGNYASGATEAYGGAIYNENADTTIIVTGSITDNHAGGEDAKGGAIYTTRDVAIVAKGKNIFISGNYTEDSSGTDANAIYLAADENGETGPVYFALSNGGSIVLSDNVRGEDVYDAEISGDGLDTTFYLLNDLYDANLSVSNTTLNTIDNEVHIYSVNTFTVTDDFDMVADVDLANEEMDRFVTNNDGEADHSGTLNVAGMNLISDAKNESTEIFFAEEGLKDNVTSSVGVAYTPIYQYSFSYDDRDDAGYFVIDRTGFNPAVMATPVAVMGAYNAFGLMFDYNFEHSDYFMKLPAEDRLALSEEQKKAKRAPKENDATKPAYYNQNELTERGAWMRAFAANESVDYGGGWESRDKYYGAMVGFDSDMHVSDNGWASVLTGYAGMLGIRQSYSGGNIRQKGGFVGLTESFYKKNFYTAWTIAAGTTKAHDYTMYGQDKTRIDQYGIAGRVGWNIKLGDEGKFSLLPTFTASFTYINPEDYTNAGGVHISGDGFYAVQLNPNIKFIMNMENGWQPYLTVGEVWTVGETSKIYANEYKLDELDLDPYTEYGIGVQKRWANERDAYVQVLGHSHGRDGILVNAGIRWNF